jgi:hypothetical protein
MNFLPFSRPDNSFEDVSQEAIDAHMACDRYGDFWLTKAIRPSFDLRVIPIQGYATEIFEQGGQKFHALMSAISREGLFDTFLDVIDLIASPVDVMLKCSHGKNNSDEKDSEFIRGGIDLVVLKSDLLDFEDLLMNDGCTGIAIFNRETHEEVNFEEHKLLQIYSEDMKSLKLFEDLLQQREIKYNKEMKFIIDAEHIHATHERYFPELERLKNTLGMIEYDEEDD